jgi:cytochrome b561
MPGKSETQWTTFAKSLHWLIAAMILVQVPLGFWMSDVYALSFADPSVRPLLLKLAMAHNTIGFLVLILAAIRLGWRFSQPTPNLPEGLAAFQRWTARATHTFLYVLLFAFPLSGWAALSAFGEFPIFFFGWDSVPPIVDKLPFRDPNGFLFYANIHKLCWQIGSAILALHIVAAIWHHTVRKDGVLTRMWFKPTAND